MYITFHRVKLPSLVKCWTQGSQFPLLHYTDTTLTLLHSLSFNSAHLTHLTHLIVPFKNPQLHLLRHTCYIVRRYFLNSPSFLRYCQLNSGCNVPQRMDSTLHFSTNPIPTLSSSDSLYRIPKPSQFFKLSIRLRVMSKKGIHPMEFISQSVT